MHDISVFYVKIIKIKEEKETSFISRQRILIGILTVAVARVI